MAHEQFLLRKGLRHLLEREPDLEVVSEASNLAEATQNIAQHQPEIVIADARALGLPASEAEKLLLRESPNSKVVFLSAHEEAELWRLQKSRHQAAEVPASAQALVNVVRNVCRENRDQFGELQRQNFELQRESEALSLRESGLTAREQEVLKLLAEGRTVRSAAHVLGLSAKTVDVHKFNLMRKLGVHNKAELVMWAIRKNVVKVGASS